MAGPQMLTKDGGREKGGPEVVCVLVPLFGGVGLEGGGPNARSNVLELWELWGCSDVRETITVAALLWPSRPSLSSAGLVWLSATLQRSLSTCYSHR